MRTLIFLFCLPFMAFSQTTKKDSTWMPFQKFIGDWTGASAGEPGNGTYERSYRAIFNNNFIEVKNKATYLPTTKNPKGEIHEDIGFISYDKTGKRFMLRQFHIESFVNEFKLESMSADGKTIVFVTESIENIPAGYRARETYVFVSDNEFTETFEIAPPNGSFSLYSKATLKRK